MNNLGTYTNTNKMPQPQDSVLLASGCRPRQQLIASMLAVGGYNPILAKSGDEALTRLSQETPNLIILESQLLGQSGYSVCVRIRENRTYAPVPVIILAGGGEPDGWRKALEVGADDCLYGPVTMSELLARASFLLRACHRNDERVDVDRALLSLAMAVDTKDPWSHGHVERVVDYSIKLGQAAGLDTTQLRDLRRGAILHDMGKLGVPEAILAKAGPLSESDWQYIKLHPILGEKICQPLGLEKLVTWVVRHHHERFDGLGYPDGLAGKGIPLGGRIVALADSYDALTSDRPYRKRLTSQQAQAVLRWEAGKQFDPDLVALFLSQVHGQT